ncbi:uncharacterized protein A1O5_06094 [Cladophialophora psammophila CBS 110553]|uniref:Xylanolytic transcriptional activator regulatory domain-containing protein n=1 Tax=Cladophialophora psammophila CBS 110553 TaxID=1182543 RepID=W9X2D6_9EURO|nr:uncharacterized protein A1O5_06094 [Cladophialophora psammophila CBS 110553]EXJ71101.1 hypothetical protein A1O5_06094 [Cladophialophora psammophila CBS 110553]
MQSIANGPSLIGQVSNVGTPRLSGVNTHTSGTEFYGGSSNLAFLARLFSKARKRVSTLSRGAVPTGVANSTSFAHDTTSSELRHLNDNRSSLVDLMYSIDYHSPVDRATRPTKGTASTPNATATTPSIRTSHSSPGLPLAAESSLHMPPPRLSATYRSPTAPAHEPLRRNFEIVVEKTFIEAYFNNKHYIHPLLVEKSFRERCARIIWADQPPPPNLGRQSHFLALYYAVVALGAINSSVEQITCLPQFYRVRNDEDLSAPPTKRSTLEWASHYFGQAKQALGDTMDISSLETCQTLFLMTVFCQNALKPHACYMYSGHAVRTAIAIGLANNARKTCTEEGKRTWWCIYSHEIEMCCSSGRLDSLMPPEMYSLPMPKWTLEDNESHETAIIPVMVDLSRILKRVSMDVYCNANGRSTGELSQVSLELNEALAVWKANLPAFLNLDVQLLNDPPWAYKQKLVLKMRFFYTHILINRPFLVASHPSHLRLSFPQHIDICLDAARKMIQLIHNAFINRMYLRTWWYCTTYTLYASMIVLYLILVDCYPPAVSVDELIGDVEKSLEIFDAMKQVVVAQRCAELTKEMLTVVKKHQQEKPQQRQSNHTGEQNLIPPALHLAPNASLGDTNDPWNDNYLATILNQSLPGWVSQTEALAHLYDPSVLEDFALSGGDNIGSIDDAMIDFPAESSDDIEQTGPTWGVFEPFEKGAAVAGNEAAGWI